MTQKVKKSIINCHTHIFTGKCVPPYIAKTFLPWPLYKLLNIDFLLRVKEFLKFDQGRWKVLYEKWQNLTTKVNYHWKNIKVDLVRNGGYKFIKGAFNIWVLVHTFYILFGKQIIELLSHFTSVYPYINQFFQTLTDANLFFPDPTNLVKAFFILFTLFFIKIGRKLIFSLGRYILPYLRLIPDSQTWKFLLRYYHIVRFAGYKESGSIFSKLKNQYDQNTGFVVLPMDLQYMGAGNITAPGGKYDYQMNALAKLKKNPKNIIFPFVFIDPRRIEEDKTFLVTTGNPETGKVTLERCFVKQYIEENEFNGFKIYPALGYYPFEENLLLLWKYAADQELPIMTHAIKGTVFYRGKKEKSWDYHPVFKESVGKNQPLKPLILPQSKNIDFTANFTNPLNYLCLLDEKLLRLVVKNCSEKTRTFFGYKDETTELKHNLSHLKICMGHYGGEDEWDKYLERDRLPQVSNIFREERDGFNFFPKAEKSMGDKNHEYLSTLWKSMDWFSIITNLIYHYPNVYADISYIVYQPTIYPLLKQVLTKEKHFKRVLYGTDFFVVRNHKSEKQLLAEAMANLTEVEFDQIARENPREFINTKNFVVD